MLVADRLVVRGQSYKCPVVLVLGTWSWWDEIVTKM